VDSGIYLQRWHLDAECGCKLARGYVVCVALSDFPDPDRVQPEHPNGQTVMLLHGKNFCGAYWGQTVKTLTGKGYRVIVPDQIGFGKSSKPDTLQYTFQLLAAAMRAVLDSAGVGKVIVLGHSMGGMVATRFALMYPERAEKFILEKPSNIFPGGVTLVWA
jgi:pimeloyl-ACP methyl ester carboxylesterase